jgi:hypothetical protein
VAPKEENQPMLETKKVALLTNANHVCVMDGRLKGGFVLAKQITIVPRTEC